MRKMPWVLFLMLLLRSIEAYADEVSLFDSEKNASAYIDIDNGMTIYLWSGKPVAYLHEANSRISVYGFNGKHLGWFESGVIWDSNGNVLCATKIAIGGYTKYEPYKNFKQFRPYKSYKEYPPARPFLSRNFSQTACSIGLALGSDE